MKATVNLKTFLITLEEITIEEYAKRIGYNSDTTPTIEKVQTYAEETLGVTLWDYPMDELDYVLEELESDVVTVVEGDVKRICELID